MLRILCINCYNTSFCFQKERILVLVFLKSWYEAVVYQLCPPVFMLWDEFNSQLIVLSTISSSNSFTHTLSCSTYLQQLYAYPTHPLSLSLSQASPIFSCRSFSFLNAHVIIVYAREMSQDAFLDCFRTCIVLTWYILSLFFILFFWGDQQAFECRVTLS